ncbi:hypothetical protein HKD37_08G022672 [Glycine soja]
MHNTLQLTNNQLVDEIYYRQPFIDLKNDDDVYTMLMCNKTPDAILNLLQSTITPTHDAIMHYNGKFDIPSGFSMDKLKDLIKQVAPVGVPPNGIHESQLVRRLFFRQPGHAKYSENLIEYEITELKNNKGVLKVLAQSNYWKRFCTI